MNGFFRLLPPEARALLGCFFFALVQVMVKRLLERTTPLTVTVWVNFWASLAALVLSLSVESYGGRFYLALALFAVAGFLGNGVARLASYQSHQMIGVSRTSSFVAAAPIGTCLLGVVLLGERPGAIVWLGVGLVVAGLWGMTGGKGGDRYPLRHYVFAVLAMACFMMTPYIRKVAIGFMDAVWLGVFTASTTANVTLLATSRLFPPAHRFRWDRGIVFATVPIGLLALGSGVNIWSALRDGMLTVISPLTRISPLFVLALSVLFLRDREVITRRLVIATIAVVLGTVLVTSGG